MGNLASRLSATNSTQQVQAALVESVLLDEATAPASVAGANRIYAGPASPLSFAEPPAFRALVSADLPSPFIPPVIYSAAGTPLPTAVAGLKGVRLVVSDATTPTYLGAYVSGGAVLAGVICTGTAWVTG
jgi:hypothetical protein